MPTQAFRSSFSRRATTMSLLAPFVLLTLIASGEPAVVDIVSPTSNASAAPGTGIESLPSYGEALTRMVIVLFAIIVALVIISKLLRRYTGAGAKFARGGLIDVVESRGLEHGKRLHLIRVAGHYLLIGASGDRLTMLAGTSLDPEAIEHALAAAARATPSRKSGKSPASFASVFARQPAAAAADSRGPMSSGEK